MPRMHITERDAQGRIVRSEGDYLEILAAGRKFNWASPYRRMCARCRRSAMRGSALCCWHDPEFRKTRAQRAIDSGDPQRIAKVPQRKHRSMMATLWAKDPWFNGRTIWLAPPLETAFRHACADAALPVETVSPRTADNLRWKWRLFRYNDHDWPRREIATAKARAFERRLGAAPEDWEYQQPGNTPPGVGSPVMVVTGKAPVRWHPALNRPTRKMQEVLRRVAPLATPGATPAEAIEQVERFLQQHHKDLRPIMVRLGPAVDDSRVRARLARAYAAALRGELAGHKAITRLMQEA